MATRDFFAFCAGLRPLELKALAALSEGRHIDDGQVIHAAGDTADVLYIINRGAVEIVQQNASGTAGTYLARGDIFGALEVLTGVNHRHLARTCESVSVRCFHRKDLPALVERVPSFFHYLSEQLAQQVLRAEDTRFSETRCLELRGSLRNFDLVTIYQTIANSSQTGELSVSNERGEVTAAFLFDQGQPRGGRFEHLVGEEAFWQLFQTADLSGTFAFASGNPQATNEADQPAIEPAANELLITALQGRDELEALKSEMPDSCAILRVQNNGAPIANLSFGRSTSLADEIWQRAATGRLTLGALYPQLLVCELKIYRAVEELIAGGRLSLSLAEPSRKVA